MPRQKANTYQALQGRANESPERAILLDSHLARAAASKG